MARLTPENVARAEEIVALYPERRSALIPLLHLAQEQDGSLTEESMVHVGELLGLTSAEVLGTASFYDMFPRGGVGTYLVAVCTSVACMIDGAYELLEHVEDRLGIAAGATTPDGAFTLEEAECIALCHEAPCLAVNWRFFGKVGPDGFDRLADDLRAGRLADEVPPHGTLNRVRREVGLLASAEPDSRPAPEPAGASAAPGSRSTGGSSKKKPPGSRSMKR